MDRYPYFKYTILLGATRALAHIGIQFTHRVFGLSHVHTTWLRCIALPHCRDIKRYVATWKPHVLELSIVMEGSPGCNTSLGNSVATLNSLSQCKLSLPLPQTWSRHENTLLRPKIPCLGQTLSQRKNTLSRHKNCIQGQTLSRHKNTLS